MLNNLQVLTVIALNAPSVLVRRVFVDTISTGVQHMK